MRRLTFSESADRFYKAAAEVGVEVKGKYQGLKIPVSCICPKGHACSPRPASIQHGQGWCAACAGVDSKLAASTFYALAASVGIIVVGSYINNSTPIECICLNGHTCYPRPNDVKRGVGWCGSCAKRSKKTAADNFYAFAKRDNVIVLEDYKGVHVPVACICASGHNCFPTPGSIRSGRGWCRACVKKDPITAETAFYVTAERDKIKVKGIYSNATTPVECVCSLGHTCYPRPASIHNGNGWCQQCVNTFDRLYLTIGKFDGLWWAKVGVASNESRIKEHQRRGWILYEQWTGLLHRDVLKIETFIKKELYSHGCVSLSPKYMPQDGATETFPIDYLPSIEHSILLLLDTLTGELH
jgi:hypothetical protein